MGKQVNKYLKLSHPSQTNFQTQRKNSLYKRSKTKSTLKHRGVMVLAGRPGFKANIGQDNYQCMLYNLSVLILRLMASACQFHPDLT